MELNSPQKLTNQIYDIYVIKTSGIPLFAGCTATDYCKLHMDQHELISGFFSAMFSFSAESFKEDSLETMVYGDILLNFIEDRENKLIFAFVHDRNSELPVIREQLKEARQIFLQKYSNHIDSFSVDQSVFKDFRKELFDSGILNRDLLDTSGMVEGNGKDFDRQQEKKPGIVFWLKGLFK